MNLRENFYQLLNKIDIFCRAVRSIRIFINIINTKKALRLLKRDLIAHIKTTRYNFSQETDRKADIFN